MEMYQVIIFEANNLDHGTCFAFRSNLPKELITKEDIEFLFKEEMEQLNLDSIDIESLETIDQKSLDDCYECYPEDLKILTK